MKKETLTMLTPNIEKWLDEIQESFSDDPMIYHYHLNYTEEIKGLLSIAPYCYTRELTEDDKRDNCFIAECDECGWFGSSRYLSGGGQIADTGDFDACYCPVCGSNSVDL